MSVRNKSPRPPASEGHEYINEVVSVLNVLHYNKRTLANGLPCYLLPKTNFLRFNLPPKTHEGDKSDLGQDMLQGWR